jgi:DNA repair exonuclease SbcCD ATPase subunit
LIEAAMYFALGLLTAGLLALMAAPILWRRASRLTRLRIERSVPLTLNEIQADKDQLRAEFAMSTRRLEMTVDRLKERANEQLIEINRKREQIAKLAADRSGKVDILKQLESREAELRRILAEKEENAARAEAELSALDARLAERTAALDALEKNFEKLSTVSDEKTLELVARGTELENTRDELAAARTAAEQTAQERQKAEADLAETRAALTAERQRAEAADARIKRLEEERSILKVEVGNRDREMEGLKTEIASLTVRAGSLEAQLGEAEAARVELEGRLSTVTVALRKLEEAPPAEAVEKQVAALQQERDTLAAQLAELELGRQELLAENTELKRVAGEEWQAERMENALLRERLNDIAGEVVKLTRTIEDETAPEPLRPETAPALAVLPPPPPRPAAEVETLPAPAAKPAPSPVKTLAERIRALQRSAQG